MFKVGDKIWLKKVLPARVSAFGKKELREEFGDTVFTVWRVERREGHTFVGIAKEIRGEMMVLLPRDELWVLASEIDEHGVHPVEKSNCCTILADLFEKAEE